MKKNKVRDFAKYEVYEIFLNEHRTIAVCDELGIAELIAELLAMNDPAEDDYRITGIVEDPEANLIPGGGWYIAYQLKDGEVKRYEVS